MYRRTQIHYFRWLAILRVVANFARCPRDYHLEGVIVRAGDDIDAVRAICGVAKAPNQGNPVPYGPEYGGTGGAHALALCPKDTPVVIGMNLEAQGIGGLVMNSVALFCGLVTDSPQQMPEFPAAEFAGPEQKVSDNGTPPQTVRGNPRCPAGTVGVGIYGRSGDRVDGSLMSDNCITSAVVQ